MLNKYPLAFSAGHSIEPLAFSVLSPKAGRVVIELQPLPRSRPLDIDAGRRIDDRGRFVPENRVHVGEIVEHSEI